MTDRDSDRIAKDKEGEASGGPTPHLDLLAPSNIEKLGDVSETLPEFLKNLLEHWSADVEGVFRSHYQSKAEIQREFEELANAIQNLDAEAPDAKSAVGKCQERLRDLLSVTLGEFRTLVKSAGFKYGLESQVETSGLSLIVEALQIRGRSSALGVDRHNTVADGAKRFDSDAESWHYGKVTTDQESQEESLPHEELSPDKEVTEGQLFEAFHKTRTLLSEDQEKARMTDVVREAASAEEILELFDRWNVESNQIVDNWLSGTVDDTNSFILAKRFQCFGSDACEALDQARDKYSDHAEKMEIAEATSEQAYQRLCELFGAVGRTLRNDEEGQSLSTEKRQHYLDMVRLDMGW